MEIAQAIQDVEKENDKPLEDISIVNITIERI
jgi:hypothetical protein